MEIEKVRSVIAPILEEIGGFEVSLKVSTSSINLFADTLTGIKLNELTRLSRAIEAEIDRETNDVALEVSSPGMDQPLVVIQQFQRHKGKTIKLVLNDGSTLIGTLEGHDELGVDVSQTKRVPKPLGKGKITVTETQRVLFDSIKETKLEFSF
jgi:ribosome maturation factor RimP